MATTRSVVLDDAVERVVPQGRRLGLVIGIDAYGADSGIPPLRAAVADARAMHAVMVDPECGRFEPALTTVLADDAATDANIRIALERLRKQVTLDDEVWFFFAGHAILVDGEHRLLPVNAQRDFLDATSVDFADLFNKIRCRRKIVFLDCCHAGASTASTRDVYDVGEVFNSYQSSGTVTYCSSDGDQKSVELQEQGHGAFTYWLQRGLRGEADADGSGVVTSDELWQYVCKHVEEDARRLTGRTQTPRLKADTSGAFALSVNMEAIRVREAERAQAEAARREALERLETDRKSLRQLLGEDDATHLGTDEVRSALKVLEGDESSRMAQLIRKALEAFRANGDGDDAVLRVRGALRATVTPPPVAPASPRPHDTKEFERRVAMEVAARSGSMPAIPAPAAGPTASGATPVVATEGKQATEPATVTSAATKVAPTPPAGTTRGGGARDTSSTGPAAPARSWGRMIAIGVGVVVVLAVALPRLFNSGSASEEAVAVDTAPAPGYVLGDPDGEGWKEVLQDPQAPTDSSLVWSWYPEACSASNVAGGYEVTIKDYCAMGRDLALTGEVRFIMTAFIPPDGEGTEASVGTNFGQLGEPGSRQCWIGVNPKSREFAVKCDEQVDSASSTTSTLVEWTPSDHVRPDSNTIQVDLLANRFEVRINGELMPLPDESFPLARSFAPWVWQLGTPTTHDTFQIVNVRTFTREAPAEPADSTKMQ